MAEDQTACSCWERHCCFVPFIASPQARSQFQELCCQKTVVCFLAGLTFFFIVYISTLALGGEREAVQIPSQMYWKGLDWGALGDRNRGLTFQMVGSYHICSVMSKANKQTPMPKDDFNRFWSIFRELIIVIYLVMCQLSFPVGKERVVIGLPEFFYKSGTWICVWFNVTFTNVRSLVHINRKHLLFQLFWVVFSPCHLHYVELFHYKTKPYYWTGARMGIKKLKKKSEMLANFLLIFNSFPR